MTLIKKNIVTLIGIILGGIAGYTYWYFIGCSSGSCSRTSVWYHSLLYGSLMGGIWGNMFTKTPSKKQS